MKIISVSPEAYEKSWSLPPKLLLGIWGGTPGANRYLAGSEPVHTWFGVGEPLVQLVLPVLLGRTM